MDWAFGLAIGSGILATLATILFIGFRRNAKKTVAARNAAKAEFTAKQQGDQTIGGYSSRSSSYGYSNPDPNHGVPVSVGEKHRVKFRWITIGLWVLTAIFFILSCFTTVSANAVAINVSMGRYNGTMESGTQTKEPWSTKDEFTTRLQTTERNFHKVDDKDVRDCVTVKASGVEACVDSTTRWAIDYDRANTASSNEKIKTLWRNYGDFETIGSKLVSPEITTVFTNVYGGYSAQDAFGGSKAEELNRKLVEGLNTALSRYGIKVDGVTLGNAHLDADDQAQLNRLFTSAQNILIATNDVEAAKQQAEANRILSESLTPSVLAQHCIDAAREIKPIMITCNTTGDTPSVIIQPNQNTAK